MSRYTKQIIKRDIKSKCPDEYILNPLSNRYIEIGSAAYRKLCKYNFDDQGRFTVPYTKEKVIYCSERHTELLNLKTEGIPPFPTIRKGNPNFLENIKAANQKRELEAEIKKIAKEKGETIELKNVLPKEEIVKKYKSNMKDIKILNKYKDLILKKDVNDTISRLENTHLLKTTYLTEKLSFSNNQMDLYVNGLTDDIKEHPSDKLFYYRVLETTRIFYEQIKDKENMKKTAEIYLEKINEAKIHDVNDLLKKGKSQKKREYIYNEKPKVKPTRKYKRKVTPQQLKKSLSSVSDTVKQYRKTKKVNIVTKEKLEVRLKKEHENSSNIIKKLESINNENKDLKEKKVKYDNKKARYNNLKDKKSKKKTDKIEKQISILENQIEKNDTLRFAYKLASDDSAKRIVDIQKAIENLVRKQVMENLMKKQLNSSLSGFKYSVLLK